MMNDWPKTPTCPYCPGDVRMQPKREVYSTSRGQGKGWMECPKCHARSPFVYAKNHDWDSADAEAMLAAMKRHVDGNTSDGYHTFDELYHHRAVLFSIVVANYPKISWKSKQHNDGSMFDGMFIAGILTPDGPATYHYYIDPYWDMFKCREIDRAPEWDGHTPAQAIERIGKLPAMKRAEPENQVFTQEEVEEHIKKSHPNEVQPLYVEFNPPHDVDFAPRYRDAWNLKALLESEGYLESGGYGVRWRCWLRRPTFKERAEVPWKDKQKKVDESKDKAIEDDLINPCRCAVCYEFDDGTCRRTNLRVEDNDFCSYGVEDE